MNQESDWTVYRTRFLVRARQLTDPLNFTDALGREHCGQPGDYLVEIFDGLLSITPRRFFEDIYVPLQADVLSPQPHAAPSPSHNPAMPERRQAVEPEPQRLAPSTARGLPLNRSSGLLGPAPSPPLPAVLSA